MWDKEEGYICQGSVIGFCELGSAVVAGECVMFGTSAANKVVVNIWTAGFEAVGVSLKGGVTGEKIPVCFYGVVKMVGHVTMDAGSIVGNSATAGTTITYGNVIPATTVAGGTTVITAYIADIIARRSMGATGTAWTLGMALQVVATAGDEILVLVGGAR